MKVICHVFFKPAEDTPPIQTIVKTFSFLMFTATSSEVFRNLMILLIWYLIKSVGQNGNTFGDNASFDIK